MLNVLITLKLTTNFACSRNPFRAPCQKILLYGGFKVKDTFKRIYRLSDVEAYFLVNASTGTGILKVGRKSLTVHVMSAEEELGSYLQRSPRRGFGCEC